MADPVRVNLAPLLRFRDHVQRGLVAGDSETNPARRALRQWAAIYRAFLRERFDRFSRGGGDWPKLAESTILARRAKGGGTRRQKRAKARAAIRKARQAQERAVARLSGLESKGKGEQADKARAQVARATARIATSRGTMESQASMSGVSILRDKGLLFNVTAPDFTGGPGQLQEDILFGVRVGYGGQHLHPDGTATIADIAGFHQEGGPRLPQRKIVVEPDGPALRRMAEVMDAALARIARDE